MSTIEERIKEVRNYYNLSQIEFSKRILVGSSTLAMWETGARKIKDIHISKICSEFNVREDWLRTGEGEMLCETKDDFLKDLSQKYGSDDYLVQIINKYLDLPEEQQLIINSLIDSLSNLPEPK